MIIFDLVCAHGHRFEGWFASGEEFTRQKDAAMVICPVCDDTGVERLPSAQVRVPRGAARDNSELAKPADEERPEQGAIAGVSAELVSKLREIVRNTENVGRRFPEEARKIHYSEAPARAIRGQASKDEAQALSDEGIEFASLPAFLTTDPH
jgi:hypothetical protein